MPLQVPTAFSESGSCNCELPCYWTNKTSRSLHWCTMAFILVKYAHSKLHYFGAELSKKPHYYGWASLRCAVAFYYGFDQKSCKGVLCLVRPNMYTFWKKKKFNANIGFGCTSIGPDHFIELLLLSYKNYSISTRVGGCYKSALHYTVQS